jgi:cytochrome c biogenesis protein CcmG, thiol:disulfide interchange protein DsbE
MTMDKNLYRSNYRCGYILILLLLVTLLSACGPASSPRSQADASTSNARLDDLPAGIGRGFPIVGIASSPASGEGVQPGMVAPNFNFMLADGSTVDLRSLQGRPVIINFWATWCGPCRIEMPELVHAANANPELVLLAVNVQEELEGVSRFAEDFKMTLPVLLDKNAALRNLYEVRGMPTTIFIDREGTVQVNWAGILTPAKLADFLQQIL